MKAFITGITGMIGSHFAKVLTQQGYDVYGIARYSSASRSESITNENIIRCDILDKSALDEILIDIKPDLILHFAAQGFNGLSWKYEDTTYLFNNTGTHNILSSCKKYCPDSAILIACSSAEYGDFDPTDCPLDESHALHPITPYGVSKAYTEMIGYQFFKNYGLKVILPRLFIHLGTGHPPATAVQNFAKQLASIKKGKAEPIIKVGDITTARDFIDVRDGINGMMLMVEKEVYGTPVNICTGKAYNIKDILHMLIDISGLDVAIVEDSNLFRPSDEPLLLGSNSKLKALGWNQHYEMQDTIEAIYNDWLLRV